MTVMRIVPQEDWEILNEYLCAPGAVLVAEGALDGLDPEDADSVRAKEGAIDYDFGGEADIFVDLVPYADHYAMDRLSD